MIRLYDLSPEEIEALVTGWGQPSYRAQQIWTWLYQHLAASFEEMSSLPKSLRQKLAQETIIGVPEVVETVESTYGLTRKDLLRLVDGETIEAVLMHYNQRQTACISTQVGCSIGCPFCATGQMGFHRDLTSGEIVAQAVHFERVLRQESSHLSNLVLMGMGEPLLNYEASLEAIRRLNDHDGFDLGQRSITLSTAGVVPGIERLAGEELQITLAVSLHAATDRLRDQLVPLNRRYPLDALLSACYHYAERTGRRVSFEWALIEGVNDTPDQAHALAARLRGMLAHVNLIPLNPSSDYAKQASSSARVTTFTDILDQHHIAHSLRVHRGIDIQAGCGQLRQRQG